MKNYYYYDSGITEWIKMPKFLLQQDVTQAEHPPNGIYF